MAQNPETLDLHDSIFDLLHSQIGEWQLLGDNYDIFHTTGNDKIHFEEVSWSGSKILLNYRKTSLSADLKSIAQGERPCFLCAHARPPRQRAILWGEYEILANPYPASDVHFTIVNRQHIPQFLGRRILDMARLARILDECCIFYNGPRCGASAPDHMHFQAVAIEDAANFNIGMTGLTRLHTVGRSSLFIPNDDVSPFGYYLMDIMDDADIPAMFEMVLTTLPAADGEEPMVNILAFQSADSIRIIVIPRRQHRPSCYGSAPDQMLVSPASLEMMGRFITSRPEDFNRLDEKLMTRIYHEVAYTTQEFINFTNKLPQ